ncbi:MAG TPA: hypothetical protein VFT79_06830, partial [Solirubrobacterales bacterium]|nr:hypothetical protein [Solirubrobacterales bacterium]
FVHNRVTGSVLGHLESACQQHPGVLNIKFETNGNPGHQKYTKVTETGTAEDLISSLNSGAYETFALTKTVTITTSAAPTVTCI